MRDAIGILILTLVLGSSRSISIAQEPRDKPDAAPAPKSKPDTAAVDAIVSRMMALDKNKDGKLTRDEIGDERLLRLFDRADANKDGIVTKEELVAFATKLAAEEGAGGGRRRGFGPGGPGGFGGPPRPGQILPPFLQEELKLTADQKKQIALLQKEVDEKLDKVLTAEQRQQLKEMRPRFGPGRPGRRGPAAPPTDAER
jgi:hypothetical protein